MTTIQEINRAIMFGDWTNTELTSMIDAVKWRKASLGKQTKASLRIGDEVSFTSSKTGMNMSGTVMKIAIKYVTVCTTKGMWRVPANMLSKVEADPMDDFNYVGSKHHY
jgi:hypothetical protein